jgi:Putative peptidoglycan binding domain
MPGLSMARPRAPVYLLSSQQEESKTRRFGLSNQSQVDMRLPVVFNKVFTSSMFSMLLISVVASQAQGQTLGRPAVSLNSAHFNPGISAQARVRTISPIPVQVHPANPAQIRPFTNPMESRSLSNPLNNNPILNQPGQNATSGIQTQSPAARNLSPGATVGTLGPTVETAARTAVAGYSVPEVRQVQTALRRMGYYRGDVDGDFGANTQNALENYQVNTGEPVTGTLSQGVLSRLGVTAPR